MKEENPFKTTPFLRPEDFQDYRGYEQQREQLEKSFNESGVVVLIAKAGFGKTTLARYFANEGKAHYLAPCLFETIQPELEALREKRFLFWSLGKKEIIKPVFIDECGAFSPKTNGYLKAQLHDKGVKVVLIFNTEEYLRAEAQKEDLTLLDCATRKVVLTGLNAEEARRVITSKTDAFPEEVVDYLASHFSKPRDLLRVCNSLYEQIQNGKEVTLENVKQTGKEANVKEGQSRLETPYRKGSSSGKILEAIQLNPSITFSELKQLDAVSNANSLNVMLHRMRKRGEIRRNDNGQYFAVGLGGSEE